MILTGDWYADLYILENALELGPVFQEKLKTLLEKNKKLVDTK